ncbi:MAG: hypothetical protein MJZ65_05565 [Paludibacteraceae bacterium]|nr:hypothetical protein [Paludibacteraceae bacterium]
MKKNIFLLALLTLSLVGCQDSAEVRSAVGTYSYKSSTTLQIDTLPSVTLIEQGALEIVSLKNKDSVLLTFNELLGGVYSTHACLDGDVITLCPFTRPLSHALLLNPLTIVVSGDGHVYDDNVVLNLSYQNLPTDSVYISAPEVLLIAKKNK